MMLRTVLLALVISALLALDAQAREIPVEYTTDVTGVKSESAKATIENEGFRYLFWEALGPSPAIFRKDFWRRADGRHLKRLAKARSGRLFAHFLAHYVTYPPNMVTGTPLPKKTLPSGYVCS